MQDNTLHATLAWLGTLPFAACAVFSVSGMDAIGPVQNWQAVAAGYGLAIASFMAGVHWGTYLYADQDTPINLLISSNAITVMVWLSYALASVELTIAILILAFLLLLMIDSALARGGVITPAYLRVRRRVTVVVVALLLVTLAGGGTLA